LRCKDRSKDDDWIEGILRRAPVGAMSTAVEGQPFINSRLFVYDEAAHAL
jgi:nitroimidazol reductase NimA-like FMN-containing flavoprotein (pyridoxamine 5'-phosphate oxidase superfamily)